MTPERIAAWGFLASIATPEQVKVWQSWPAGKFADFVKSKKKELKGKSEMHKYLVQVIETQELNRTANVVVLAVSYEHAISLVRDMDTPLSFGDFEPAVKKGLRYRANFHG
jgi:hypothetical protein